MRHTSWYFATSRLRPEDGSSRTLRAVTKFICYNPEEPRLWVKNMKAMLVNPDRPDVIPLGVVTPGIFPDRTAGARITLRRVA